MEKNTSLKIILIISIMGILFSGYLSYNELLKQTCPIGQCSEMFSLPVCVYGLVMYLTIFIVAILGLSKNTKK